MKLNTCLISHTKFNSKQVTDLNAKAKTIILLEKNIGINLWFHTMQWYLEKTGLKLTIQKTKIMASGPITSWQIDGETVQTVSDFTFLGSKSLQMVTAAVKLKDTCSLEEKLWPT